MVVDAITAESVRQAVHAIRYAQMLQGSPLLDLDLVTMRLRADGLADTPQGRAWVLGRAIEALVTQRLAALRGLGPESHRAESSAVESFRLLGEDLSSGSIERASWGLLHHRYLLPAPRRMREVSERYGIPRRTIADRLTRACRDLAQVMRTAEVEASQRLARASRSAVDPVVVHAGAEMHGTLGARRAERDRMRTEPTAPPTRFHPGEASRRSPSDLEAYRLGRIAEWSQPRYRLDTRFVALTLLVDMGEEALSGRWMPRDERFTDLRSLLADVHEPVVVLLGPPGSGKSTLLRRLELDLAGYKSQGVV